ncbi:PAS domain-containing protein [Caproiciproducens sp. NJN-50]|uniref:sigma-54 interaction domain-containing protein n=1 Tax=Caproiciproducens sp. NJN-50 TaxID=2507162 RepID=UPI000FFE17EF|nr:sigma 54-interacting transcriptional regulator [Caproiciproducens sp. NJN-50]QAT48971.1 PAS domain-containing protein [Caproiciproducens sp. NJN-50]
MAGDSAESERYKYIFNEVLKITDDGFIVVDKNGVVTDINDQYCDFLGKPKSEIVGYPIKKTIKNSKMPDIVTNLYSEELALHKYVSGDTKENDNTFVLVSRSCVYNDQGEVVAGVAQVKFRLQALASAKRMMNEYAELEFYREEYRKSTENAYTFDSIVGGSECFVEKKRAGIKAAQTDFAVLLTGETGTGKEVFARAIHNASSRKDKPMVSINCAAIPAELLESELFGYDEGAFTGAKKGGKKGKFQLANSGTIFLDEIGDMPLCMQAKILRVLQEEEVEPLGGSGPEKVDVRVIAATRKDLNKMIETGEFREDLYYRLNVVNIELPPLRQRREDILDLAKYFLAKLNRQYNQSIVLSGDVKRCFYNYPWPGNVRELNNVIMGAYAICDRLSIDLTDLPAKMAARQRSGQAVHGGKKLSDLVDDYERQLIRQILREKNNNCRLAAEEMGIHRSALYKKIAKLKIKNCV